VQVGEEKLLAMLYHWCLT